MNDPNPIAALSGGDSADALAALALNLHWSWSHAADELWERLDPELWECTQNPWVILLTVSQEKMKAALGDPAIIESLLRLRQRAKESYESPGWFQEEHSTAALNSVAYFSMEFMLTEALPIYSGGLGNVAGDQLKAASDLGVPVVGIGLLYGQGYFRQEFDARGRQRALYPVNDPGQLPIRPLRLPNGEWLRLQVQLPGSKIWLRCWQVSVGRTKLFLLDSNDFANTAEHRCITSELYGGDAEMRIKQEIVLGIGGWRLLRAIDLEPEVCHLNEGHAAFAVLERARCYMEDHQLPFEVALNVTRPGNVFTTHTAVSAGFDLFDPGLVVKYLGHYAQDELAISMDDLLAMGRKTAGDTAESFNMAFLAVHGSGQINGVSKLHGHVSRQIFQPLFPRWPQAEVPIGTVTNGVHMPTWDSLEADTLWTTACGKKRWRGHRPSEEDIRQIGDAQLWHMRCEERKKLVDRVRRRFAKQLTSEGASSTETAGIFNDNTLTLGFARRFATYKRPNLLLHDPDRLIRLLSNPQRPVQLVLAGKAHPQDLPGQALIEQWNDFIRREEVRRRVVFLSDYDMLLTQELVQGVDLWVNTPRRPWEACGTSGMKILVNGGLNVSELDGWWAEAYSPEVGWALGDGKEHDGDLSWDNSEAEALYDLLEREIAPEFYERNEQGLPTRWLSRVRESMARLTRDFSATRAIREYTENHYLPAASRYAQRSANGSELGVAITQWQRDIARRWGTVRFGRIDKQTRDGQHIFRVEVYPGGLSSDALCLELYADPVEGNDPIVETMTALQPLADSPGMLVFGCNVPAARPSSDFTPRIRPSHANASVPLEAPQILWAR